MSLPFTKMHGLGNDFMVVQTAEEPPPAAEVAALANRRTGVGFDQLLWVQPARSAEAAASYRIFNADGSEAEQCGNGARCIASFLTPAGQAAELVLEHPGGQSRARVSAGGEVSVEMGVPAFAPADIPFTADETRESYPIEAGDDTLEIRVVSMGNPHAVLRTEDVASAPVERLGPLLERHERFPNRANIGFVQVVTPEHVRLRVFERGVGETLACGTGACAATVVGRQAGWLNDTVRVELPGGVLGVTWRGPGESVWLSGEAITVFEGTVAK